MTNNQIIFNARMGLMKAGIIGTTGRVFNGTDADGNPVQVQEPEEIHTFAAWKELGYQVRKGEKCIARLQIWKHGKPRTRVNKETGDAEEIPAKMFMKTAFFFSRSQVDEIPAEAVTA